MDFSNLYSFLLSTWLNAQSLQVKQASKPGRTFATQADNSASAAGAAPKLQGQASLTTQQNYCNTIYTLSSCQASFLMKPASQRNVHHNLSGLQSMMGPYATWGLAGAGAGLLFLLYGSSKDSVVSVPGTSCKSSAPNLTHCSDSISWQACHSFERLTQLMAHRMIPQHMTCVLGLQM